MLNDLFFSILSLTLTGILQNANSQPCTEPSVDGQYKLYSFDNGKWLESTAENIENGVRIRVVCYGDDYSTYKDHYCIDSYFLPTIAKTACTDRLTEAKNSQLKIGAFFPFNDDFGFNQVNTVPSTSSNGIQIDQSAGPNQQNKTAIVVGKGIQGNLTTTQAVNLTAEQWSLVFYLKERGTVKKDYVGLWKPNSASGFAIRYYGGQNGLGVYKAGEGRGDVETVKCKQQSSWNFWAFLKKTGMAVVCDSEQVGLIDVKKTDFSYNANAPVSIETQASSADGIVSMSCLLYIKQALMKSKHFEMLRDHCNMASNVQPTPTIPSCVGFKSCTWKRDVTNSFGVINMGSYKLGGAATIVNEGLAIQLAPSQPHNYGFVIRNGIDMKKNWRIEIKFRAASIQGCYTVMLASAIDPGSSYEFTVNPANFVGFAVYADLTSNKITLVKSAAANSSLSQADIQDSFGDSQFKQSLGDWNPGIMAIEYIDGNIAVILEDTMQEWKEPYEFKPQGPIPEILALKNLPNTDFNLIVGAKFWEKVESTAVGTEPNLMAINFYDMVSKETTTSAVTTADTTPAAAVEDTNNSYEAEIKGELKISQDLTLPSGLAIKATGEWNKNLSNNESEPFKELSSAIEKHISLVCADYTVLSVTIEGFHQGSIITQYIVALRSLTQLTEEEIQKKVQLKFSELKGSGKSVNGIEWSSIDSVVVTNFKLTKTPQPTTQAKSSSKSVKSMTLLVVASILCGILQKTC